MEQKKQAQPVQKNKQNQPQSSGQEQIKQTEKEKIQQVPSNDDAQLEALIKAEEEKKQLEDEKVKIEAEKAQLEAEKAKLETEKAAINAEKLAKAIAPDIFEDEPQPVDEAEYNEYTSLKFLALSETKLKDETKKRLEELEAKLKSCAGSRPIRTVRAAIKNEQVLLVENVPVPDSILQIIKNSQTEKYYLGE